MFFGIRVHHTAGDDTSEGRTKNGALKIVRT